MPAPLKIIHVAYFSPKLKGASFFSVPFKLSNGLVRAGNNVLNFSDRDEARASTIFGSRKFGVIPANRKLIEIARRFRPDLMLFGHADVIRPATLAEIKQDQPNIRMAQWNVDALFEPDNVRRIKKKFEQVDCTFVTTSGTQLEKLGAGGHKVAYIPNPVDPSIERTKSFDLAREELRSDLFFAVGSGAVARCHGGVETSGNELAKIIKDAIPDLRCDFPGTLGTPHKAGTAFEDALAGSAMALNLSRQNDVYLYSSDRLAQVMGCGLLTFIDRAGGFEEFFSDDDVGFYATEDELIKQIDRHLRDDDLRRRRAASGWKIYHSLFDCTKVAQYMLDVLWGKTDPATHRWTP